MSRLPSSRLKAKSLFPIVFATTLLVVASLSGLAGPVRGGSIAPATISVAPPPPLSVTGFTFQPGTISLGSQSNGSVLLNGGTAPYYLWFNTTPPGCAPPSVPVTSPSTQFTFLCHPSSSGSYSISLAVLDSSSPRQTASATGFLTVNSNGGTGGNGNNGGSGNNNGNGSNGFSLPSGLLQVGLIVAIVFLASMVALAAGMIATAAMLSRRLRQLNETMAKANLPPKEPKSPP